MGEYFCGWYFKCQSDRHTVAVIPAEHKSGRQRSASVQLITDDNSWSFSFPYEPFQKHLSEIRVADNYFGRNGFRLNLEAPGIAAKGTLRFGPFSPLRYDIMGPFCLVPFMECRHSVVSMRHRVDGTLFIRDTQYSFHNAVGYIEGDCGRSFPKRYAWTQCFLDGGSLFLSAADIPIAGRIFTGVIGVIHWHGTEYRLATYLGAKAQKIENGEIVIRQGDLTLTVRLLEKHPHPLNAPVGGSMTRTIHESASCRAMYCLEKNGSPLFSAETDRASFEYEY